MNHGVRVNSRGFSKHFKLFSSNSVISRYFENTDFEWRFENRDSLYSILLLKSCFHNVFTFIIFARVEEK